MDYEKIGKAMAECYTSKKEQEVDGWKMSVRSSDRFGSVVLKVEFNGEEFHPMETVCMESIIRHPERFEQKCVEKVKWLALVVFARYSARTTADSEGEMQEQMTGVELYEDLKMGWINCCDGCLDDFDKHSDSAIEEYVKTYAKSYGVDWELDKWGNYKFCKA